jgi:nucleoside phosphorylase
MVRKVLNVSTGQIAELPDLPAEPVTPPTQRELDVARYRNRAQARDGLLAEMAADNMARVRSGAWGVGDLTALMSDPSTKVVLELINALSFEMAASALAAATHPLLTPEIKAGWVAKLQEKFFLVP